MTDLPRERNGQFKPRKLAALESEMIALRGRVSALEQRIPADREMIPSPVQFVTVPCSVESLSATARKPWSPLVLAVLLMLSIALFVAAAGFAAHRWHLDADPAQFLTHRYPAPY